MEGFSNKQDAHDNAALLEDALRLLGSLGKFGIDIGKGAEIKEIQSGMLPMFEVEGYIKTTLSLTQLSEHLFIYKSAGGRLTDPQRACMSLINDSYFAAGADSQFVLRISAVEALCGKGEPPETALDTVAVLEERLSELELSEDCREHIHNALQNAKRKTVRQGYKRKFNELGLEAEYKPFDELYRKRSKLVHLGEGRGGFKTECADALRIVNAALEADLRTSGILGD
jgi:hypothetical protein